MNWQEMLLPLAPVLTELVKMAAVLLSLVVSLGGTFLVFKIKSYFAAKTVESESNVYVNDLSILREGIKRGIELELGKPEVLAPDAIMGGVHYVRQKWPGLVEKLKASDATLLDMAKIAKKQLDDEAKTALDKGNY